MSKEPQVWYEPHPVSAERKAELRARGYRIVDALFKPEGHANPEEEGDEPEGAKKAATVPEIKASLESAGVTLPEGAKKAELQALLTAFERSGLTGAEWNNLADEDRANRVSY